MLLFVLHLVCAPVSVRVLFFLHSFFAPNQCNCVKSVCVCVRPSVCTTVYVHSCFSIDGFGCLLLLQSHSLADKAAQSSLHLCCTAFLCCGALLAAAAAAKSFDCIPLKLSHSRASCEPHGECLALPQLQPTTQSPLVLSVSRSIALSFCFSVSLPQQQSLPRRAAIVWRVWLVCGLACSALAWL